MSVNSLIYKYLGLPNNPDIEEDMLRSRKEAIDRLYKMAKEFEKRHLTEYGQHIEYLERTNLEVLDLSSHPAVLEQMAEELNELSQAVLKMARKVRNENPTPKSEKEILSNIQEEYADVLNCIEVLCGGYKDKYGECFSKMKCLDIMAKKRERWIMRLKDK